MIEDIYKLFKQHPKITTDSRSCPPGSMFFALKGESFNGNNYAISAIEKGCSFSIIDDANIKHPKCILVEDVLKTLQELALYHRKQFNIPVIGITGSNGKTTTKELTAAILNTTFNTLFTQGNFNNHIGVPLTLLNLKPIHDIAIIEMGANHPGEIKILAEIACPDYGLITNIGKAHLEGFGSYEAVIETKSELYQNITSSKGKLFVNSENELLVSKSSSSKRVFYGEENEPTITVIDTFPTLKILIRDSREAYEIQTHLNGAYNIENIRASACIGSYFGVTLSNIKRAIESYQPNNNRSQIERTKKNILILDMYNANPTSMNAAIEEFQDSRHKNKVLILGEMKELGSYSKSEHDFLLKKVDLSKFSRIMCIGNEFCKLSLQHPSIKFFINTKEATEYLKVTPIEGATVLLKGSRGVKLENLIRLL